MQLANTAARWEVNAMTLMITPSQEPDSMFGATVNNGEEEDFALSLLRDSEIKLPFWLAKAIQYDVSGFHEKALDLAYDTIDDHLLSEHFESVDQILSINPDWLSTRLIVGFLTATRSAADKLNKREKFKHAGKETVSNRGELESGLFAGL